MTEEQVKQFTKRPPAQYRRPEFYFRGGDALREQEYLQEEYKKALSDFRIAQQKLRQTQEEVQDATDVLAEREGYTNALATYLERDTQAATTENQMKNRLRQLESEIADVEVQLKEIKAYHNPAALASLQKEKAHYMIEIQRGNRTIAAQEEQRDEAIRQIAACTVNGRYREARNLEYLTEKTANKKTRLRKSVANLKKQFDVKKPVTPLQDEFSRRCRSSLQGNIKMKINLYRIQEIESTRKPKHEKHINDLLDQISELNDRMVEIGIPDDVVNIDEFRDRVLNEDYESDDDIDENQEEPASGEPQNTEPEDAEQSSHQKSSHEEEEEKKEEPENGSNEAANDADENNADENDDKKSQSENKDKSMSGDFDEDDDKKSKSTTNKSMSGDFDDDDDKKSKSTTNKSMSGDFDDDDDKKSKSTTNKSMSGDFDDDEEKKESSNANDDNDDDEKKESSNANNDDDDEKKESSNANDDDDDDEKKTTSAANDDDDDDDEKKTTSGGDDDEEKKSTENDDDDDDEKKKSESNFDDDDFDNDDD